MNRKLLLIIGIVVLVIAVPLIQARVSGGSAVQVQTEKVMRRSIQSSVLASGKLVHEQEVKLTTEEIGRVTAIFVEEGAHAHQGPARAADRRPTAQGGRRSESGEPRACRRSRSSVNSSKWRTCARNGTV